MTLQLPTEVLFILYLLKKSGYEAYLVGGAVRDLLLNSLKNTDIPITDFDFTTNATPEQIQTVFPENFYENEFGTVGITREHLREQIVAEGFSFEKTSPISPQNENLLTTPEKIIDQESATKIHASLQNTKENQEKIILPYHLPPFEITTYRSESEYDDFRHPKQVQWGENISEDLQRRDFTINAIAFSVDINTLLKIFSERNIMLPLLVSVEENDSVLVDPYNGISDIIQGRVVTVGDSSERFQEDALRLLRAIRIAIQLNMEIDEVTWQAITKNASLIQRISWERIRDELLKMLKCNLPARSIKMLDKTGLLEFILPELLEAKGVNQSGHHTTDVWTHSLDALDACPSPDPIVRLATLLHDIGKPPTAQEIHDQVTFYNHEIVGSRIASAIGKRLKLSKHELERLFLLVRHHMFYYQPEHTDASIRRFMRKVGLENIDDILALREGDRLGSGAKKTSWRLEEMKQRMIEQLHQPMEVKDLAISGNDLITELGMKPGPKMGKILNTLFEAVIEDSELNFKDTLLRMAKDELAKK